MQIDETVDVTKELQMRNPEIRDMSPVHIRGTADIDARKAAFHLLMTGHFILPCSRTLADVDFPFQIRSTETFLLRPEDHDADETEDTHAARGGVVDLMPIIQELLLLEIPMQVFSEEAKNSESLPAGNGWEVLTEEQLAMSREEEKKKVDPRLAGLAKLLETDKDKQ
jgi:uncharacterized protein